jgi:hypothetical protein
MQELLLDFLGCAEQDDRAITKDERDTRRSCVELLRFSVSVQFTGVDARFHHHCSTFAGVERPGGLNKSTSGMTSGGGAR